MTIDDQAGDEPVVGELLPQKVGMSRQYLRAPVAEVRREPGTGADGVANLRGRCRAVPNRGNDVVRDEVLDKRQRPGNFGGEGNHDDPPTGRLVATLEVVEARG